MAKKITKKQFNDLRNYIVVLDATVEAEKKDGKAYTHWMMPCLVNALIDAERCSKWDSVYAAYIYEKECISHDSKAVIYTRILRARNDGTFITDREGRFIIALENNESNGQTMSLSHWFCGNKHFQEYV